MKKSPKKQDTKAVSNSGKKSTKAKSKAAAQQDANPLRTERTRPATATTPISAAPVETPTSAQGKESSAAKRMVGRPEQPSQAKPPVAIKTSLKTTPSVPPGTPGMAIPSEPTTTARKPKRRLSPAVTGKPLNVPPILLEGDLPPSPAVSGPGLRYALAPQPIAGRSREIGELPEAYGTGRIFLAARDPHWLFASWDFTPGQQKELNARSRDGHLVLRVFAEGENMPATPEIHVHPESRTWFINVVRAETRYHAEIGFYERSGNWCSVSHSQSTFAPPDAPSEDIRAEFATIPPEVTFKQVLEVVEQFVSKGEGKPLLEAVAEAQNQIQQVAPAGDVPEGISSTRVVSLARKDAPFPRVAESHTPSSAKPSKKRPVLPVRIEHGQPWAREQQALLKRLIHMDEKRRVFIGSIEITELVRRQLEEEIASIAAQAAKGIPSGLPAEEIPRFGISSPLGDEIPKARGRKFWFKVNAELIVYGATEPNAKVTVAARQIRLRPDGTFSFRFALPDGRYQLPAVAVSADGEEAREARLEFVRSTEYQGTVDPHPQDATLTPPRGEHIQ